MSFTDDAVSITPYSPLKHNAEKLHQNITTEFNKPSSNQEEGANILHPWDVVSPHWNDHTPFALLNRSFDTISDPTADDDYCLGYHELEHRVPAAGTMICGLWQQSYVDFALREDEAASESSGESNLRNVSPIRIMFENTTYSTEIPLQFPLVEPAQLESAAPSAIQQPTLVPVQLDDPHFIFSNPFYVLRSCRSFFEGFKYLLPCLTAGDDLCPVQMSKYGHFSRYRGKTCRGLHKETSVVVGQRRVEAAIYAFGGNVRFINQNVKKPALSATPSIFRARLPSLSPPLEAWLSDNRRKKYVRVLPTRYRILGSSISWQLEEDPPVWSIDEVTVHGNISRAVETGGSGQSNRPKQSLDTRVERGSYSGTGGSMFNEHSTDASPNSFQSAVTSCSSRNLNSNNQLRYRCKLCGKPKQNHNCPFSPSLQRSIGVTVYPALNAYTAAEPGIVAPSLTSMNNFVSYEDSLCSDQTSTPELTRHYFPAAHQEPLSAGGFTPDLEVRLSLHPVQSQGERYNTSTVTPETRNQRLPALNETATEAADVATTSSCIGSASSTAPSRSNGCGGESIDPCRSSSYHQRDPLPGMMLSATRTAAAQGASSSSTDCGLLLKVHHDVVDSNNCENQKPKKRAHSNDSCLYHDPADFTGQKNHTANERWAFVGVKEYGCGSKPFPPAAFGRPLVVPAVTLRPEHYRAITSNTKSSKETYNYNDDDSSRPVTKKQLSLRQTKEDVDDDRDNHAAVPVKQQQRIADEDGGANAYAYPAIPLTYRERMRLSDTLFVLSREVPSWTTEIGVLLDEARGGHHRSSAEFRGRCSKQRANDDNEWDQAVAELLTQVVVGLYCCEGDHRLDGLQKYLWALGIAC